MSTDSPVVAVPPEISDTIGRLQTDIEKLQRELALALEVWQVTLKGEKEHLDELFQHKELAWQEQEGQWAKQSQAYEERLDGLKVEFEARLKQSEQNAAYALAELEDAWQREKLEWGPAAQAGWPAQRRELEEKVQTLERELTERERRWADERAAYEQQLKELQALPAAGPNAKVLEDQLAQFRETVATFQDRAARSDELVNACLQALDYQISVLYDLVHHYALEQS